MDASYPSPIESVADFEKVFHPVDAVAPELDVSISQPSAGTRKINKRRLDILSEEYPEHEDVAVRSEPTLEEGVTLPEVLFSERTYEYCGFTPAVTGQLWSHFQANRHIFPEFDDPNHQPDPFNDTEWTAALQDMGLNIDIQNAIMLEEFSDIRLTESAAFWTKDTVDSRPSKNSDELAGSERNVRNGLPVNRHQRMVLLGDRQRDSNAICEVG